MSPGEKKNNEKSDQLRKKGNKSFLKKDYFEALSLYNESLRYAEIASEQLGLCYGNRSAAFLKVKMYNACMDNIQLAREHNFPIDNLTKLITRENDCKALMESNNGSVEETWNDFFKLSYAPNPNFPYLVDCLELKRHERGLLLATKHDLKAGDIIAITDPLYRIPVSTTSYRCNYCLADKFMNFIPCSGCVEVMFCNENCMKKALDEFHQFECGIDDNPSVPTHCLTAVRMIMKSVSYFNGSLKKLKKFFAQNMEQLVTPFDFSLNDPTTLSSGKMLLLTHFCDYQQFGTKNHLTTEGFSEVEPFLERHPKLRKIVTVEMYNKMAFLAGIGDMKFFKSIDGKALSTVSEPCGIPSTINYFGGAIDVCFNLLLHSCAPNIFLHPYNGKIIWIVLYPIKAGDWISAAHKNMFFSERSREDRKREINSVVCCCRCPACTGNWKIVLSVAITPINVMRRTSVQGIEAYKDLCDKMNKSSNSLVGECDESLWLTISHFRWNLFSIGRATFWNQIPTMNIYTGSRNFF